MPIPRRNPPGTPPSVKYFPSLTKRFGIAYSPWMNRRPMLISRRAGEEGRKAMDEARSFEIWRRYREFAERAGTRGFGMLG